MEQQPKTKIQFKPLHDGMGFHPFSDGLPYAPASKTNHTPSPSNGSGATSAGRPRFVTKGSIRSTVNSTVNSKVSPSINPFQLRQDLTETISVPHSHQSIEQHVIRRRVFAYLLDMVVHAGFWLATNLAALYFFHYQIESEIFTENLIQFLGFFLISQWLFIALQEMLFETTLGKSFFNLEFKRNHGSLLFRSILFMLGAAFFGLGLFFRLQDKLGQVTMKTKVES